MTNEFSTREEEQPPRLPERGLSKEQMREVNRDTNRQMIGMVLFTAVGLLASARNGFMGNLPHPYELGILVSILVGAIAGLIMFPHYRIAALTSCPFAAFCGYAALNMYLPWRETVNTAELILIQAAASIPAIIIGNLIRILVYSPKQIEPPNECGG